ncbi:hypothetical protein [Amycolatopsis vastitatis]|jgi:hypothetical protein|uniref:Uncharacterized protein n=1 Tax=Amycolatopsis vastitatis TaxID=1905142 RepID=A0A229T0Q5_9PSEU|nr:hypothetical protein [Amycolatopsis vastitatis]OXM64855.1 hypothetical protein CF165_25560 [Amycolatopsis vastitatis]
MDGLDFHLLVAALRTDRADVESYHRVLSETLGSALPPGMVEVARRRTFADRVAGRDGQAVSVRVNTPDRVLVLRTSEHGGVAAEIHHVVRGVVISRKQTTVDDWLEALAQELTALAEKDTKARAALSRLLGG